MAVVAPPWFDIPPDAYGGIERVCFDLVEGLAKRGNDVVLLAAGASPTRASFVSVLQEHPPGLGDIEHPVQEVRYAAEVARALAGIDADVVHDHSLAGPLLGLARPGATLLTAHGPTTAPVGDYYRALGLPLVALSDAQRAAAPDLPWVGTVPNAIDVEKHPFRAAKDDFVLFLGRLSPEKGAHLAPDAARAARCDLVLAGKCSEAHERRYFEEEVAPRLGPGQTWVGEVFGARKHELLGRARCLLCPAQWNEPFGLVSVEALASGTPVVGLARGALPEIVDHGRTGWICEDAAELPEGIRRAAELDPRECRADALRRFHVTAMAEAYERVYRRIAKPSLA